MNKIFSSNHAGPHKRQAIGIVSVASISFMVWICIGLLQAMAFLVDNPENLVESGYAFVYLRVVMSFVPLAVLNTSLAVLFWYRATLLLRPKIMALSLILFVLIGLLVQSIGETLISLLLDNQPLELFWSTWRSFTAFSLYFYVCFLLLMYFSQVAFAIWRRNVESELELANTENERIELRLHLLQGQLKPHFLFNALNSIGALVRGDDRELAVDALRELNGLLSYVAHASKQEWLSVADEIQFVREYVDMQKLRFGDRMQIEWEIESQSWATIPCAPLLFQPLIENAIHHGVEPHYENCHLKIGLHLLGDMVQFTVDNSVFASIRAKKGHGLGLSSTKERIALLYPGKAQLVIANTVVQFIAHLAFPKNR
ncbi:MAG: histidine kinase [Pseudomonadota bacterium]